MKSTVAACVLGVLCVLCVVLLTLATYRFVFEIGLVGWDSYPIILTARIDSFTDFFDTFREELMDGRYPGGHWYRPMTNLAFALDHAVWGLDPVGYHATDLAILVANALLIALLAHRLGGGAIAVVVSASLFVIHPLQLEVVPVAPRRSDTLCLLFALACLAVQPGVGRPGTRVRAILACGFAAAAVGAKETGAVVAPLVVAWHFWRATNESLRRRVTRGLRASAPVLAGVFVVLCVRTAVLGGIGGSPNASALSPIPMLALAYLTRLVYPQPFLEGAAVLVWVGVTSVGLTLACITTSRHRIEPAPGSMPWLATWFAVLLMLSSLASPVRAWYAMLFVAPYSIALGLVVEASWRSWFRHERLRAAALAVLPISLIATHLQHSGLVVDYDQWSRASDAQVAVLRRLDVDLEHAEPGDRIVIESFVGGISTPPGRRGVRSAATFWDYGVQAYVELTAPDKSVRVRVANNPDQLSPVSAKAQIEVVLIPEQL